jgi:hypothetical protein
MKTLIATLALATLVAAPAFAQSSVSSNSVTSASKAYGQDPDAGIRSQMLRDYSTHAGGGAE